MMWPVPIGPRWWGIAGGVLLGGSSGLLAYAPLGSPAQRAALAAVSGLYLIAVGQLLAKRVSGWLVLTAALGICGAVLVYCQSYLFGMVSLIYGYDSWRCFRTRAL